MQGIPRRNEKFKHLKYYKIFKYIKQNVDWYRIEYKTHLETIALLSKEPKIRGQNLNCLRAQQGLPVICYVV
jgi:hypothetical protein